VGPIERYLIEKIKTQGTIHLTLIDPEKIERSDAYKIAKFSEKSGTTAIMVGGSTAVSVNKLDGIVNSIKKEVHIPVILFPSNITGISKNADAIWFMSLLNSNNPYFITGTQALGAPLVKKFNIEPISLGYIIVGNNESAAAFIGQANSIPLDKPEASAIYALAAQYLGMHFVYLEAGSGAKKPIPSEMIKYTKKFIDIPLIVGGGIKNSNQAKKTARSGADIIVTGTLI
jgi:phosphoglycerol geranylgeranyltransferase